jgi:RecA/RadA recombinase
VKKGKVAGIGFGDFMKKLNKTEGIYVSDLSDWEYISTGSVFLDEALGGGWPVGRISDVYGAAGSGKSILCLQAAQNALLKYEDRGVFYIDTEGKIPPQTFARFGLDAAGDIDGVPRFVFVSPDQAEQALSVMMEALESGLFSLVILDSVDSLIMAEQDEKEVGAQQQVAAKARLLSQELKRIAREARKSDTCVLLTSQVRANMGAGPYGSPYTVSGGEALKHECTVMGMIGSNSKAHVKRGDEIVSQGANFTIKKTVNGSHADKIALRLKIDSKSDEWCVDPVFGLADIALSDGIFNKKPSGNTITPSPVLLSALGYPEDDVKALGSIIGKSQLETLLTEDETVRGAVLDLVHAKHGKQDISEVMAGASVDMSSDDAAMEALDFQDLEDIAIDA